MTLLLVLGPLLFPIELDAEEKAFVGQCFDRMLNGKSERVRRGAEDALVAVGVDVLDELSLKTGDAAWKAIDKLCVRIGAQGCAERLESLSGGTKDATRIKRLTDLAAKLRSAVPGSKGDPGLAAKVNALLAPLKTATRFSSSDPVVAELVSLGHDIVPILLGNLRPGTRSGMVGSAVEAALKQLVEPGDLPILKDSLLRGNSDVASSIGKLMNDGEKEALKVLHQAVERGVFGFNVAGALESSPEPADTARVVVAWFKARPGAVEHEVAAGADLLAKLEIFESAEALVPWIARAKDEQTVYHVGRALVRLGDAKGFPLLIRVVAHEGFSESSMGGWLRASAARELNQVSGKALEIPEDKSDPRFGEVAKDFKKWWESVKGRLKFDKSSRSWSEK